MVTKSQKQAQELINQLGISVQDFCAQIGVSSSTENLDNETISAVTKIMDEVNPWFESSQGAWVWFTTSAIKGFGDMSPSEVIRQHGKAGADSILDYVASKITLPQKIWVALSKFTWTPTLKFIWSRIITRLVQRNYIGGPKPFVVCSKVTGICNC